MWSFAVNIGNDKKGDIFNLSRKKSKNKKKVKFKDSYSVAKKNIQIVESGKIRFSKDQTIEFTPFVKESIEGAVVSRLDNIISRQDVKVDSDTAHRLNTTANIASVDKCVDLLGKMDSPEIYTAVKYVTKKEATDMFNFLDKGIVGSLLRCSTLSSIYKGVKSQWEELNTDDSSTFMNVLFLPKIYVYLDDKSGKTRKKPYIVNLLVIASPTLNNLSEGIEKVEKEEGAKKLIRSGIDAGLKLATKHLIIDPYDFKWFMSDMHLTAHYWSGIVSEQPTIDGLDSIDFALPDDDSYIIFRAAFK